VAALRYLLVIALVLVLALLAVADHVERTQLGYDVRALEEERARLVEDEKMARLDYERAVVPERLVARGVALHIAPEAELLALTGVRPKAPAPPAAAQGAPRAASAPRAGARR
jgi:hypothetical protein